MASPYSTGGASYGGPVSVQKSKKVKVKRARKPRAETVNAHVNSDGPQAGQTVVDTGRDLGPQVGGSYARPAATAAPQPNVIPYGKQPITDGSTITNNMLNRAANAAAVTQYGPQDTQLQQQYAASDRLVQQAPQWWQDYVNQTGQIAAQDAAAWQAATNQITNVGGALAAAASRNSQADQSAMAADAALRGASVDPEAAARAQQAAQVNASLMGNQANLATLLGANSGSYFRGQQDIGLRQKVQAPLDEIAYRRATLDPQAASLAQQKGAYRTQYKTDTLSNEQRNVLERMVFGQDVAKDQADIALKNKQLTQQAARDRRSARIANKKLAAQKQENQIDNARDDRKTDIAQQNADANTTRANKPTTTSGKDRFGNTPKQRRAAQDSYSRAKIMAQPLPASSDPETVTAFLVHKQVNPIVARAIAQMKVNGYVDSKTARQLAKRGIRSGYTTKRPKKPTQTGGMTAGGTVASG